MRPFMSEETLMYSTMVEMLQSRANERPNQEAYRFLLDGELNEESMTFAELNQAGKSDWSQAAAHAGGWGARSAAISTGA